VDGRLQQIGLLGTARLTPAWGRAGRDLAAVWSAAQVSPRTGGLWERDLIERHFLKFCSLEQYESHFLKFFFQGRNNSYIYFLRRFISLSKFHKIAHILTKLSQNYRIYIFACVQSTENNWSCQSMPGSFDHPIPRFVSFWFLDDVLIKGYERLIESRP
jgi:hypothetical protein